MQLVKIAIVSTLTTGCAIGYLLYQSHTENHGSRLNMGDVFELQPVEFTNYDVFDTGVADIDSNGTLDIFTVNHSAQQQFFLNDGNGRFTESADYATALSQDYDFAFAEDSNQKPKSDNTGVLIYRLNRWLHIENNLKEQVSGTLDVAWPMDANFESSNSGSALDWNNPDDNSTSLDFDISPGDTLRIRGKNNIVELPHLLKFSENLSPDSLFIGQRLINPQSNTIELVWRDRHAMAWADIDQNNALDVFVSRGGIKGQIDTASPVNDELFLQTSPGVFEDKYASFSLIKGACPGREADWVDIDNDGLIDLHVVCGRQRPLFQNQLWKQLPDATFKEISRTLKLDYPDSSLGTWFDADNDGLTDYLALQPDGLALYKNKFDSFERQQLIEIDKLDKYGDFSLADHNADGYIDVFIPGKNGSLALQNKLGKLTLLPELPAGLPNKSLDASWIDFNMDGLPDLHLVPQGIYLQTENGSFEPTGILNYAANEGFLLRSNCSWFDANSDGNLDVMCHFMYWPDKLKRAYNKLLKPDSARHLHRVELWTNLSSNKTLSSIDITSESGNRLAIGSKVLFETDSGRETASFVGISEGSRYSQGHYRIYYSPGDEPLKKITVQLPGNEPVVLEKPVLKTTMELLVKGNSLNQ